MIEPNNTNEYRTRHSQTNKASNCGFKNPHRKSAFPFWLNPIIFSFDRTKCLNKKKKNFLDNNVSS